MQVEYGAATPGGATGGKASEAGAYRRQLSHNASVAALLLVIDGLDDVAFRAKYGPHGYGLLPFLYTTATGNALRFWDGVRAVGNRTGFEVGNRRCDYAAPRKIATGDGLDGYYSALQPSNLNLQRRAPRAFENLVHNEMRRCNAVWRSAVTELGMDPEDHPHPGNRANSRIQHALIGDSIRRAVPDERQGALSVLLRNVPSLTGGSADILALNEDTTQLRDTLFQIPVLMLFPRWFRRWAQGKRQRNILDALGLPRSAAKLLPAGVGAVAGVRGFARNPFRDAVVQDDLVWLSERVGGALPPESFRQRKLATIATRLACEETDPARCEAVAFWLCTALAVIKCDSDLSFAEEMALHDYLTAPPEMLDASAVRKFGHHLTLESALAAASDYAKYLMALNGLSGPAFPTPAWAPADGQLPNAHWRLVRVKDPAELFAAARLFSNCAAGKVGACRVGKSAIYIVIRNPMATDKQSARCRDANGGEFIAGAMLELIGGSDGKPVIFQLLGRANRDPAASIVKAVNNFLAR
jgi:hypothetical protein